MATIDTIAQLAAVKNTGIPKTALDIKNIAGFFMVPKGQTFTAAEVATLQTTLLEGVQNASKSARFYPFANFVDFKDSSEEPVVEKFGFGGRKTVRDGINDWAYRFEKGGQQLLNAGRTFNGDDWDVLFVDKKNVLVGTAWVDGTGANGIKAVPVIEFYTNPAKQNDGKANTQYWLNVCFDPKFINEEIAWVSDAGFDILDVCQGLGNAVLGSPGASGTSGTYNVTVIDDLGNNLVDLYGADFVAGLFACINYQTGLAIPITTATISSFSGVSGIAFVVDKTSANYPATTGQKVSFNQASIASWIAAGIDFESTGAVSIVKN
jgi:hypothetical protein